MPGCSGTPEVINPGAFEYPGDGVDNDCQPITTKDTDPLPTCGPAALMAPTTADQLVQAMDLCQTTTANPPLSMKTWGVISSTLTLADGTSAPTDLQAGILAAYGPNVAPKFGGTMGALSSGTARALGDPGYVHPQNGPAAADKGNYVAGTQVSAPASYLAAHGGTIPSTCGPACLGCNQAYDSANLTIKIRVPTNAKSFSYKLKFYSAEFPEFLCKQWNDFFLALLTSSWVPDPNAVPPQLPLPADGNIAFDAAMHPVSVNNALFTVCQNQPACNNQTELILNGMGGWNGTLTDGGGTKWLTNQAPVVPGETIDIRFVIWDAGDHNVDSIVLLDQWKWDLTPATVSTHL